MILVSGASGNVGRCVVRQLMAADEPVRVLTRDPSTARFPVGVEVVGGDLTDPASLAGAFDGITHMFFFTPANGGVAAVQAAAAGGVHRVVVLSSAATQKADPRINPIAARHDAVEKAVQAAGLSWTFLRPDSFAANVLAWAPSIRSEGVVRAAYGRSLRNPIHEQDVAAVATVALLQSGHEGKAYMLTGPVALTQIDQVEAIGVAIGRAVRFEEWSRQQAFDDMTRRMPAEVAERLLDYAAKSVGHAPAVTSVVEDITGRPARAFSEWAQDHAADFG